MDISLYSEFCESLFDDFEGARITAVKLLEVLSHHYGDWYLINTSFHDFEIKSNKFI